MLLLPFSATDPSSPGVVLTLVKPAVDQLNVQQIHASGLAFAAVLDDGSVVSWSHANDGGDSNAVQDQLRNVQQIQASGLAFAAILGDGSVVAWGNDRYGGDSSAVQDQLKNMQQIQASYTRSFAWWRCCWHSSRRIGRHLGSC